MPLSNPQLDEIIRKRQLVSISRKLVDSNSIQGFPLAYSTELLLLRYVHDFYLDGLLVVRREDITACNCSQTDQFQRKLLETERKLKPEMFRCSYSIDSFDSFLTCLDRNKILILENEKPEAQEFYIGQLVGSDNRSVTLHEFSGAGNWEKEPTTVAIDDITCCQIENNYIKFYERHFQRLSQ